jgi:hypothetical protein
MRERERELKRHGDFNTAPLLRLPSLLDSLLPPNWKSSVLSVYLLSLGEKQKAYYLHHLGFLICILHSENTQELPQRWWRVYVMIMHRKIG